MSYFSETRHVVPLSLPFPHPIATSITITTTTLNISESFLLFHPSLFYMHVITCITYMHYNGPLDYFLIFFKNVDYRIHI